MVTEYKLYQRPGTRGLYARRTVNGKRETKSLGTADRKIALAKIRELNGRAILAPTTAHVVYGPDSHGMTVGDACKRFRAITNDDTALSADSKEARETHLAHIERILGVKTLLRDLRREDVDRPELRDEGRAMAKRVLHEAKEDRARKLVAWSRGKPYTAVRLAENVTPHTIHKELCSLRGVLTCCDLELALPVPSIMPAKWSHGYVPRGRAMTLEQMRLLLAELEPHRRGFVAYGLATGARLGEIRRARPREDVDLKGGFVRLRGTKTKNAERTVPFAPVVRELLEVALSCLPQDADGYDPWNNVGRDLPLAGRHALGAEPRVSPNTLRHSWATLLEETGLDRSLIAEMGGWTSTAMLDRVYGHRRPVASKTLVDAHFARVVPIAAGRRRKTA